MSVPDADDIAHAAATERQELQRDLRRTMLSGVALTVPFFITLLVLSWALDFLSGALTPLADLIVAFGPISATNQIVAQIIAGVVVLGIIFVVGLAAQRGSGKLGIGSRLDDVMADVPGFGSIYTSVDRMSEVLLESDTESFQEVKLVEFPREGSFAVGFLTADAPSAIEEAAGHDEMLTVYVPMAPNPVMGGHLLNLPVERIHDVDLSVEEGMQAIMTTGVAVDQSTEGEAI